VVKLVLEHGECFPPSPFAGSICSTSPAKSSPADSAAGQPPKPARTNKLPAWTS